MITHTVARTMLFDEDGRLLMLRRSKDDVFRPGELDLPGGGIDDGEEVVAGALRETLEEAGIELVPSDLHLVFARTHTAFLEELQYDVNIVNLTFAAKVPNDTPVTLSDEHYEYGWYPFEEILTITTYPRHVQLFTHLIDNAILKGLWG